MKKAIVLLSGGLDSATLLYYVRHQGWRPSCLVFDYSQRHRKEIGRAVDLARKQHCGYEVARISLPWQGSSLLDRSLPLPRRGRIDPKEIPSTYVPARNIIFLSFAASYAEAIGAKAIFIGANAIDYSGYPDCRPEFLAAYQAMIKKGMKSGVQGQSIRIYAPFIRKTKAHIIRLGMRLDVPYERTWSCYRGGRKPCGRCDSCLLRQKGFEAAGIRDPLF